jgi:predicted ATPase/class 3 adenylate cyclase
MTAMPQGASRKLPTGTVTFAFTDIEGSTVRWDRDRATMQSAVRRHDELMRAAIETHGGAVFKTIGDAFCAAFERPEEAVAAMLDVQRAIGAEDFSAIDGLRVRAAIHTGIADERDGDYFGPTLNRVARLLAIGHGGQVLVSNVTTELVRSALPTESSLRDLGEHRLRDLARPEQVYQLVAPDLAADFPPLRSLAALSNNLPVQVTSFIARKIEIAKIVSLIEKSRLVTLIGSGGIGKTRTSLQVAANLLDGWRDGVWFVELAPLSSGEYIPSTVAQALGDTLPGDGDAVANLVRALKAKHALLVFDNCEHLVDAAARVIAAILHACPQVNVLASSRQRLGISGEATYKMPTLDVPTATSLFIERANAVDDSFGLTDENAPIVADICRRLDGIPLAIELAASRVGTMSLPQLRERLDARFRLLTGGSRDVLPRQQTLRALIDWSHDLLDDRERTLFRRLGIFVNGFTLEGAVAVGSGEGLDDVDVFDVLTSLIDKSLVLAEPDGDSLRYRLLESTRAYASEKLEATDERELVPLRHLRYLRNRFAELWAGKEDSSRASAFFSALATELEDIRFALDGAPGRSAVDEGAELLSFIGQSLKDLGLDAEGIRRCEGYIAALSADKTWLLARLSTTLAFLLNETGQKTRAAQVATEAVSLARASGDAEALLYALRIFGFVSMITRRYDDAEAALTEAQGTPSASPRLVLSLLADRAVLSMLRSDFETAVRLNEQLREEHRALGNVRGELVAAVSLAEAEHALGRTRRAIEVTEETLPARRAGKNKSSLCIALQNLAGYRLAIDDLPGAIAAARESIGIYATEEPDRVWIAIAIEQLSLVHALRGDLVRAAREEGYASALLDQHGLERELTEAKTHVRLMALLRDGLPHEELAQLLAEGAALSPSAAVALALADS